MGVLPVYKEGRNDHNNKERTKDDDHNSVLRERF